MKTDTEKPFFSAPNCSAVSLILNLRDVEYLSSSGIGEIVHLASRFRLVLASPSEAVRHLLQLAEVLALLHVVETEEDALSISRTE